MRSFEINPDHIMTEVYSYPFPEVRHELDTKSVEARFMLNTLDVQQAAGMLATYSFAPELELPAGADGALNLDELHVPIIDRIRHVQSETITGLDGYGNAYPTHGSSQALFNLMAEWKARGDLESVAILRGEYDGYSAYANSLHVPVTQYESLDQSTPKAGEVWFVSNPSALDGNWLDKQAWDDFTTAGHNIVYDAAYAGLTGEGSVDVSSPNIQAVITSPSKQFGVFRYRHTGVTYSREPVSSLYGTKWFKDVPALLDTLNLFETYGMRHLPTEYRPVQQLICKALSESAGGEVTPSDVLLLAHGSQLSDPGSIGLERFKRGDNYRFGLAKLFEDTEVMFDIQ